MRAVGEEFIRAGSDLGEDGRGAGRPEPRDGLQELALPGERDHHLFHLGVAPGDHRIEVVEVFQMQLAHQRVMGIEAALEGQGEVSDLRTHPAQGQIGEHRGAAFSVDESFDHRPTRDGADRGGHRVQLDPRVLQHRAQPL